MVKTKKIGAYFSPSKISKNPISLQQDKERHKTAPLVVTSDGRADRFFARLSQIFRDAFGPKMLNILVPK